MKVSFAAVTLPKSGALAVPVQEGRKLLPTAAQLDKKTGGALSRAMSGSRFEGKSGELLEILVPAGDDEVARVDVSMDFGATNLKLIS